jgi:hypothetical protein
MLLSVVTQAMVAMLLSVVTQAMVAMLLSVVTRANGCHAAQHDVDAGV